MTKAKRTYEPWYWANEHTRLYMRRGYLLPGVSVEERVKEIAQRAEALTKVEGFGRKFLEYMARGWYSSPPHLGQLRPQAGPSHFLLRHLRGGRHRLHPEGGGRGGDDEQAGGGTSLYLGRLRPRGPPSGTTGRATAPLPSPPSLTG